MARRQMQIINKGYYILVIFLLTMVSCVKTEINSNEYYVFKQLLPFNNSPDVLLNSELKWSEVSSASIEMPYSNQTLKITPEYIVFLWKEESGKLLLVLQDTVSGNTISPENLEKSTNYYWKVIAQANGKIMFESDIWMFRTVADVFKGDVILSEQKDVDLFGVKGFSKIIGKLEIVSSWRDPILDLSPLSKIDTVTKDLLIHNNKELSSISGFKSLKYIGGNLIINENSSTSIDAFENLIYIKNQFAISDNVNLTTVYGFENLSYVGGNFSISNNDVLTAIKGYENLAVAGNFTISYNNGLKSIYGFNNLKSLGGSFYISNNGVLTGFTGFENLSSIKGGFYISDNDSLRVIDGFMYLNNVGEMFTIFSNDALAIINGFKNLMTVGYAFTIFFNHALITINGFDNLISTGESSAHVTKEFKIYDNLKLISLTGFNRLKSTEGDFSIYRNFELTIIDGFNDLTTIGGGFSISYNIKLLSISDFNNLEYVEDGFSIGENYALTTIDGFKSLTYVSPVNGLYIKFNSVLSSFCFIKPLLVVGNYQGIYDIYGNLTNPTIDEIKAMVCN